MTGFSLSRTILLTSVLLSQLSMAAAQSYSERPIRLVGPYPPGGGVDFVSRVLAQKLTALWSQSVIVDPRPGANGMIATDYVAKSKPDGQTVLMINASHAINAGFYPTLPYDSVADFDPVTLLGQSPFVLIIHPSLPAHSVKDLIAIAKEKPGQISYASSGNGSPAHLGMELFNSMAHVSTLQVPYKGVGLATTDFMAGRVQIMLVNLSAALPMINSGKARVLAFTSTTRSRAMPEVPTASESGLPGYVVVSWYGMLLPAKTPQTIRMRLHDDVVKAMSNDDVRQRFAVENIDFVTDSPEEFAGFLKTEIIKYSAVIKKTGAKPDN